MSDDFNDTPFVRELLKRFELLPRGGRLRVLTRYVARMVPVYPTLWRSVTALEYQAGFYEAINVFEHYYRDTFADYGQELKIIKDNAELAFLRTNSEAKNEGARWVPLEVG